MGREPVKMHIDAFDGLSSDELCERQQEVFTTFFNDDTLDIGLGSLRFVHIQGALYLIEQHANMRKLKKWQPQYEKLMHMLLSPDEMLSKSEALQIAALSWHMWGVLSEQVAFYGEHLLTLALFLYGYNATDSIHALPYMKDWFTTSFDRTSDPFYSSYVAWREQLVAEKDSLHALVTGSDSSYKEVTRLKDVRSKRVDKAEQRVDDWLVEWLRTSIKHQHISPYNIFQSVYMQNFSGYEILEKNKPEKKKPSKRKRKS